jgi:hypothetical protein
MIPRARAGLLALAPLAFAVALAVALVACSRRVTPAECDQMLTKYIAMSIAGEAAVERMDPKERPQAIERRAAARRAEPSFARYQGRCQREVRKGEFDCAMAANTPGEWEACID